MPVCHLHVGLYKSASTSLQRTILANQAALAARGIYIPRTRTNDYKTVHHSLAWQLNSSRGHPVRPGGFAELQRELAGLGTPDNILMSSENFQWKLHRDDYVQKLVSIFASMGYRLRIIAYVRPQVSAINASYAQATKMLSCILDIEEFTSDILKRPRFDYQRLLLPALRNADVETVCRPFTRSVLPLGIERDFFAILGLDDNAIAGMTYLPPKNTAPGPKTVAACLMLARRLHEHAIDLNAPQRFKAWTVVSALAAERSWDNVRFSGISAEQAQAIAAHYARSNDEFAYIAWSTSWQQIYAKEPTAPDPVNTFRRETATDDERCEFDSVVATVWKQLNLR